MLPTHERAHTHVRTRPRKVTYSFKQVGHSRQSILGGGCPCILCPVRNVVRCASFLTVLGIHCISRSFPLPPQCMLASLAAVSVVAGLSPAARSSGRLAAARRSRRRCRLARTRPEKPVRDPGGGGRLGCSGLSRRPPVAPGSPQPTSPFPTIVLPMFGARHRTLAPIRHLRPADAGVCASRSGGGASDSKTLPEYSPRPACDGGGHCATAGTPTQNAAYACGV